MIVTPAGTRATLLTRGWYVATPVELAFMRLSGRAHDLLIIIKHVQGAAEDSGPLSAEHLARLMGTGARTVQLLLAELRRKGALSTQRTGRASRHTAHYTHATVGDIRILMGREIQIPDDLVSPADVQDSCASDVQDSCSPPLYKEPSKEQLQLHGAEAPAGTAHQGDEMRTPTTPHPQQLDEMDPALAFGPQPSQELPDTVPDGPEGLFPAQDITGPPAARHKPTRSRAQLDTPMALAAELDQAIRAAPWDGGPAPVNRAGLARNLSSWKRDGVSADQIRRMITRYVAEDAGRAQGKAPWIDFVAKRHRLLALETRAAAASDMEAHRFDGADYWLGTMAPATPTGGAA